MSASNSVRDRELERQGRRIGHPALRFLLIGALLAIPVAGMAQVVLRDLWDHRRGRPKSEPTVGTEEHGTAEGAVHVIAEVWDDE